MKLNENTKVTLTVGQLRRLVNENRKVEVKGSRSFTNALVNDAEEGLVSWEDIAREALAWMSEDDVRKMAEQVFDYEEDEGEVFDANNTVLEIDDEVELNDGTHGKVTRLYPNLNEVSVKLEDGTIIDVDGEDVEATR